MKMDAELVSYIQHTVKVAQLVGIDNIIIEPGFVRAIDDNRTVVLWSNKNVPDLKTGSIGLNRISGFTARYDIAKVQDGFTIEAIVDIDKNFTKGLVMKAKGIKIDYRCANPATIKAPKQINDTMKVKVQLSGDAVHILQKGQAAMGSDHVTLISNKDGVSFELSDINNDVFSYTFASKVEPLVQGCDTTFANRYPVKTLLALFKYSPDSHFEIGEKGILNFPVNGLNVYVLPQV